MIYERIEYMYATQFIALCSGIGSVFKLFVDKHRNFTVNWRVSIQTAFATFSNERKFWVKNCVKNSKKSRNALSENCNSSSSIVVLLRPVSPCQRTSMREAQNNATCRTFSGREVRRAASGIMEWNGGEFYLFSIYIIDDRSSGGFLSSISPHICCRQ